MGLRSLFGIFNILGTYKEETFSESICSYCWNCFT